MIWRLFADRNTYMARGHGAVQRRLLDALTQQDRLIDTIELAAFVFDVQPNDAGQCLVNEAQVVSVRRALGKFAKEGKAIDCGRNWRSGRRCWASPPVAKAYYDRIKDTFGRRRAEQLVPGLRRAAIRPW
jgi:hypothetical protein